MIIERIPLPDGGFRCTFTPENLDDWLSLRAREPESLSDD